MFLIQLDGIDVNIQNKSEESPLHIAAQQNNMKIVLVLLNHKSIDVNLRADIQHIQGYFIHNGGYVRTKEKKKEIYKSCKLH